MQSVYPPKRRFWKEEQKMKCGFSKEALFNGSWPKLISIWVHRFAIETPKAFLLLSSSVLIYFLLVAIMCAFVSIFKAHFKDVVRPGIGPPKSSFGECKNNSGRPTESDRRRGASIDRSAHVTRLPLQMRGVAE